MSSSASHRWLQLICGGRSSIPGQTPPSCPGSSSQEFAPPAILDREIRDALLEDDRVDTVDEVNITDPDANRRVSVAITVTLVDGEGLHFNTEVSV